MKLLTLAFILLSNIALSQSVDLKLKKNDQIEAGKGFIVLGFFTCVIAATTLKNDNKAPKVALFAGGMIACSSGIVIYSFGKRK